jgi:hypothetical protein
MIRATLLLIASIALTACGANVDEQSDAAANVATSPPNQPPVTRDVDCEGQNQVSATMDYTPTGPEPRAGIQKPSRNLTPVEAVRAWDEVDDETTLYVEENADRATAFLVRQDGSVSARLELRKGEAGWGLDTFDACPSATPWGRSD